MRISLSLSENYSSRSLSIVSKSRVSKIDCPDKRFSSEYDLHQILAYPFKKVATKRQAWPSDPKFTESIYYRISKIKLTTSECFPLNVLGFSSFTDPGTRLGLLDAPVYCTPLPLAPAASASGCYYTLDTSATTLYSSFYTLGILYISLGVPLSHILLEPYNAFDKTRILSTSYYARNNY